MWGIPQEQRRVDCWSELFVPWMVPLCGMQCVCQAYVAALVGSASSITVKYKKLYFYCLTQGPFCFNFVK